MTNFFPPRGSIINALETGLLQHTDIDPVGARLELVTEEQWMKSGRGDPLVVPFQSHQASEQHYALRLAFCDADDPMAVRMKSRGYSAEDVDAWADELSRLWDANQDR